MQGLLLVVLIEGNLFGLFRLTAFTIGQLKSTLPISWEDAKTRGITRKTFAVSRIRTLDLPDRLARLGRRTLSTGYCFSYF